MEGFLENSQNQKVLESTGLKPVPVIHDYYGREINYYMDKGYDMVALGSILDTNTGKHARTFKDVEIAIEKIFKINSSTKIHLFAASSFTELSVLPLYSSDSTSWTQNGKYGYIKYWNEHNKLFNKTEKIYFEDSYDEKENRLYFTSYEFRKELEEYLDKTLGINYDDLIGNNSYFYRQVVNSLHYIDIEERITQEHKRQGFIY
ncbi:MAG: hypothetical protein HQK79_21140 [Desulfobacterales bacterium]|nr:hypothetical protein [Desulfobacterales bacterium]